jgi:hypothetical protein
VAATRRPRPGSSRSASACVRASPTSRLPPRLRRRWSGLGPGLTHVLFSIELLQAALDTSQPAAETSDHDPGSLPAMVQSNAPVRCAPGRTRTCNLLRRRPGLDAVLHHGPAGQRRPRNESYRVVGSSKLVTLSSENALSRFGHVHTLPPAYGRSGSLTAAWRVITSRPLGGMERPRRSDTSACRRPWQAAPPATPGPRIRQQAHNAWPTSAGKPAT